VSYETNTVYYGSGTEDRITSGLRMAELFSMNWCHDRHLETVMANKTRLHQSILVYLKNIPAKFYTDPIW